MAITDAQKVDLLYKKIGFGVAKTDTSAYKSPSNEANASPLLTRGDTIWVESGLIPGVKPASNSSVLVLYQQSLSSAIECTLDTTVSGTNRTWLTNYNDWISAEFGPSYQVKVYAAPAGNTSPETYGTQLFADGSGNADAWYFDYQSGILNFPDTNVPSSVTGKKIYVVGARYVGLKGVGTLANLNIGNLSVDSISINNAAILGGYLSNISNITAVTANLESLYSNILNATSGNLLNSFIGNLSTGNAVITGGYISSVSNITAITGNVETWYASNLNSTFSNVTNLSGSFGNINNFISSNVILSGGTISNVDSQINNLSSGNVLLAGGVIYNVNLQANNFSTANAYVSGGVLYNIDIQANNLSTANALITSGIIYNVDLQANNFSTGNALVTGGDISNVNAQLNNLSSGNVLLNGGLVYNIDLQANNFSTGNALITGGDISNVNAQINNFSTANALVTGGDISNVNAQINNFSSANILVTGGYVESLTNLTVTTGNVQSWYVNELNSSSANIQTLFAANFSSSNAEISGGYISSLSNANINTANIGNVKIEDITIASITGNLILSPLLSNSNAVVVINGTSALQLPSGTTGQQPTAYAGAIRWNNSTDSLEFFNGSVWSSLLSHIENQTIAPDGTNISYNLDYTATAEGIIVSINGTLQQPGVAYTVAGTTITFAEIPLITDTISIRYLAAGTTTAENAVEINSANVALNTGAILIDSFNMNVYRSVKYMTSTTSSLGDSEFAEFAVTQFDPIVSLSNINKAVTSSSLTTITANINGPYVQVYATATSTAQMRIQKTYFII